MERPRSGSECIFLRERNHFFRMSKYRGTGCAYREQSLVHSTSQSKKRSAGLSPEWSRDLCILGQCDSSRGIELPFDAEHGPMWFDALLNCAGGSAYLIVETFEKWWPESTHLPGKDILTTHCVYWPTFLVALGLPLPKRLVAPLVADGWSR